MTLNGLGRAFLCGEIGVRYVWEAAKLAKTMGKIFEYIFKVKWYGLIGI